MTQSEKFIKIATKNYKALLDFQVNVLKPELFKDDEAFEVVWRGYKQLREAIYDDDREFFKKEEEK